MFLSIRTIYNVPVHRPTFRVGYPKVVPLHVSLGVEVLAQVQLIISVSDFNDFAQIPRLESRLETEVRST